MTSPLLKISNLSKNISGLQIIKDLGLTLNKGEILAVIGPNGAGKTTLIDIITGFQNASEGAITFEDNPVLGMKPYHLVRKGIVRTFQNLELVGQLTVRENLELPFLIRRIYSRPIPFFLKTSEKDKREMEQTIHPLTHSLGLQDYLEKTAATIPYGIRKKVELAKTLLLRPKLLILDEPVAGLNQKEKEFIHSFIKVKKDEMNLSLIIVEHNLNFLKDLCDKVLVIDHGKLIFSGALEEALTQQSVIDAYLGKANNKPISTQ